MRIGDLFNQFDDPKLSDREVAEAIFSSLTEDQLIMILAGEVRHRRRALVVPIERKFSSELPKASFNSRKQVKGIIGRVIQFEKRHIEAFYKLRDCTFSLGDGERVSYGEATSEQHEQRAHMQFKQRDTLDASGKLHLALANIIKQHDANNMDEVIDSNKPLEITG